MELIKNIKRLTTSEKGRGAISLYEITLSQSVSHPGEGAAAVVQLGVEGEFCEEGGGVERG